MNKQCAKSLSQSQQKPLVKVNSFQSITSANELIELSKNAPSSIKQTLGYMLRMLLSYNTVCPSQKEIAHQIGMGRQRANWAAAWLHDNGIIEKHHRGNWWEKRTNVYTCADLLRNKKVLREIAPYFDFKYVKLVYLFSVVAAGFHDTTRNKILTNYGQSQVTKTFNKWGFDGSLHRPGLALTSLNPEKERKKQRKLTFEELESVWDSKRPARSYENEVFAEKMNAQAYEIRRTKRKEHELWKDEFDSDDGDIPTTAQILKKREQYKSDSSSILNKLFTLKDE